MRLRASFLIPLLGLLILFRAVGVIAAGGVTAGEAAMLLAALATPLLPLERRLHRIGLLRLAVALLVGAGISTGFEAGAFAGVAGGALLLHAAVGYLDRRSLIVAAAVAVAAHHALVGVALRGGPAAALETAAAMVLLGAALLWMRSGEHAEERASRSYERRAGGMRARGAFVLGIVIYSQIAGMPPTPAGAAAAAAGALLAALLLARAPTTLGSRRAFAVPVAAVAAASTGVLISGTTGAASAAAVAFGCVAAASATLLFAVALHPAGGRRPGGSVALGLAVLPLLLATGPRGLVPIALLAALPVVVLVLPRTRALPGVFATNASHGVAWHL